MVDQNSADAALEVAEKLTSGRKLVAATLTQRAEAMAQELALLAGYKRQIERGVALPDLIGQITESGYTGLSITENMTLGQLQKEIDAKLQVAVHTAKDSEALRTIQKNEKIAEEVAKKAESETEKKSGFFSRTFGKRIGAAFEKHAEWMETKTPGARLGFAVGELTLGSIATSVGSNMLSQAITGLKQENLQQIDDKGGRTIVLVMKPMSAGERTFKVVAGTGTTAAGLVATVLGFYGIFHSH